MNRAPWLLALAGLVARGIVTAGWWLADWLARAAGRTSDRLGGGYAGP